VALVPLNPPAPQAYARRSAWNISAALKFWHLTSLDAPTVAAAWACAFACPARVRVQPAMIAVLALVVWAIYIIDRLLDARTGLEDPSRHRLQERHWFHWRHRRVLGVLAGIAAVTAGCIVERRLAAPALQRDSLMGLATLAYFSGVHGRGLRWGWIERTKKRLGHVVSRELIVGVIFSAGCVLPVLPSAVAGVVRVGALLAVPAAAFAAVAWLNLTAIGRWEAWAEGSADETGVRQVALRLAAASGAGSVAAGWADLRVALLLGAVAVSALLLAWLDQARERLDAVTLRAAADLVLLTPLALLIPVGLAR
jgi:hypothetical protein